MSNTRIYPLRTSSNVWKIKLYSKHICNDDCKLSFFEEPISRDSSVMFIIDNPDYDYTTKTCKYNKTLNHSSVRIDSFCKNNPNTIDGEMLFENQIVIPDRKINVQITFPLKSPKNILIETEDELGFSLKEIVYKIQQIYRWIYKREEETCSEKEYVIINQCKCLQIDRKEFILEKGEKGKERKEWMNDTCPICLEEKEENDENDEKEEKNILVTKCEHFFHKDCLSSWLDQKETCPICRAVLYECNQCRGSYVVYHNYKCKVIPKEMRGIITNRNETNGMFGIHSYDKEDLFMKSMTYNRLTKTLYPEVVG